MTETDIERGHTKATLHARGVNKSWKKITFFHLNSSNFNGNFKDNFTLEKVKSILVVVIRHFCFFFIFTLGSVLKLFFDGFFRIAFGYTIVCKAASKLNHWDS